MNDWLLAILAPVATAVVIAAGLGGWKLITLLLQIHHQVYPNKGGSLFDKVSGIDRTVRTHDARFKAYQDADGVATFYADGKGRVVWTSTGLEDLFGQAKTPITLLVFGLFDFVVDDERGSIRRRWESCFADERPFDCNCEVRVPTDGKGASELIWVRVAAQHVGTDEYSGYVRTIDTPKPASV